MTNEAAPWPDYEGNQIYDGDIIQHPSGQAGVVEFDSGAGDDQADRWYVNYSNGSRSRLSLQVGSRGRAVVVEFSKVSRGTIRSNDGRAKVSLSE